MEALRAEMSFAEICRKYSISESQFYKWNKELLRGGKKRLSSGITREVASSEVFRGLIKSTPKRAYCLFSTTV